MTTIIDLNIDTSVKFLKERCHVNMSCAPRPQRYFSLHSHMVIGDNSACKPLIEPTLAEEAARCGYN